MSRMRDSRARLLHSSPNRATRSSLGSSANRPLPSARAVPEISSRPCLRPRGPRPGRVVELLVYLAAHDGSATRGEWLTDVSPEKALSDGYVRNLVLLSRRSLEALTGDGDLLAYDRSTQRFTLAERVRADWTIFRSLAAGGGPNGLRAALSLVRGMPFGANPEPWTSAAGISYAIVAEIVDTALSLAELAQSDGEARLATSAARQGQLADRYDQGLWRVLLRSAGDPAAREDLAGALRPARRRRRRCL